MVFVSSFSLEGVGKEGNAGRQDQKKNTDMVWPALTVFNALPNTKLQSHVTCWRFCAGSLSDSA